MLSKGKKGLKEGNFVFAKQPDGKYNNIIFGTITGVKDKKIGISGIITVSYTHLTLPTKA